MKKELFSIFAFLDEHFTNYINLSLADGVKLITTVKGEPNDRRTKFEIFNWIFNWIF